MNVVEQHAGCIWVALFMAVGVNVLLYLVGRIRRSVGRRPSRDMTEYVFELEDLGTTAVRADLYAAHARAALAKEIGRVPADFDPTLLYACQVSAGVHRAATAEAERQGIIRSGTYERLFGRPIDDVGEDEDGPSGGGGDRRSEPVALDEARRNARRARGGLAVLRSPDSPHESRPEKRRPAVPCSWSSDGRLTPVGRRRAS